MISGEIGRDDPDSAPDPSGEVEVRTIQSDIRDKSRSNETACFENSFQKEFGLACC